MGGRTPHSRAATAAKAVGSVALGDAGVIPAFVVPPLAIRWLLGVRGREWATLSALAWIAAAGWLLWAVAGHES